MSDNTAVQQALDGIIIRAVRVAESLAEVTTARHNLEALLTISVRMMDRASFYATYEGAFEDSGVVEFLKELSDAFGIIAFDEGYKFTKNFEYVKEHAPYHNQSRIYTDENGVVVLQSNVNEPDETGLETKLDDKGNPVRSVATLPLLISDEDFEVLNALGDFSPTQYSSNVTTDNAEAVAAVQRLLSNNTFADRI